MVGFYNVCNFISEDCRINVMEINVENKNKNVQKIHKKEI